MNTQSTQYSERTDLIGRSEPLNLLERYLIARGENHFVYFWADGGLGKTRILEELQKMVKEFGPGYLSCGTIDLYHTDLHGISDVRRTIVDGLDPGKKYFVDYRKARIEYELLRERGADPNALEKRRLALNDLFIRGMNELALEAFKLVVCFDTIEYLQYESSTVEQLAGSETSDTRLKGWMLDTLPKLHNVLIVFAGRPKHGSPPETVDHHTKLLNDFTDRFGRDFKEYSLPPLDKKDTEKFLNRIRPGVVPDSLIPIVHCLTGGKPIYIHLVIDRLNGLLPEARTMIEMFNKYSSSMNLVESDPGVQKEARNEFQQEIVRGIMESGDDLSFYLSRLALMPKGFNPEILQRAMGLPVSEANDWCQNLRKLSFVKQFKPLPVSPHLPEDRLFFHDELYQLLTNPDLVPNLRLHERMVAQSLVTSYYDQEIKLASDKIIELSSRNKLEVNERAIQHARLNKLLVERMYYQLICDPMKGYQEYKRLSVQANRDRQVGFGMRLLDEFLRFYNDPAWKNRRRQQCRSAGLSHEQIVRESAQLWVERFHWWGQYDKEIDFAEKVSTQWEKLHIRPEDTGVKGNIIALWGRVRAMKNDYELGTVNQVVQMLKEMPPVKICDHEQLLARGRLETTIGYQYRLGGLLDKASQNNEWAIATFHLLRDYPEELAIVLNNQAWVTAKQGEFALARSLGFDAMRIAEQAGNIYSMGMNLNILASVERMARQDYNQALEFSREALVLFQEIQNTHGIIRGRLNEGGALRRLAEKDYERGRKLEESIKRLDSARETLEEGIIEAQESGFQVEIPNLQAELSKVYRGLGIIARDQFGLEHAMGFFRKGEELVRLALEKETWSLAERGDLLEDLAELLFRMGDSNAAEATLQEVEQKIGKDALIKPGMHMPKEGTPNWYFLPLGKVEQLRSEIAANNACLSNNDEQYHEALQHFVLASVYFEKFSRNAVEKNRMTEEIYSNYLRRLSPDKRLFLMSGIRAWTQKYKDEFIKIEVDVELFLKPLERMMGSPPYN